MAMEQEFNQQVDDLEDQVKPLLSNGNGGAKGPTKTITYLDRVNFTFKITEAN